MEYTTTKRGARSLIYQGYKYQINCRAADGRIFWRCATSRMSDNLKILCDNLKILCEADTINVDGTFSTCPHLFYQIFTFHAFKHGKQFPLVYCLLPNKRRETYIRSFEIVKDKAQEMHLNLDPDVILSDFELTISQAEQLVFPKAEFKGCLYHFCQALNLKIQNIGIQTAYNNKRNFRKFIQKTAALAFVPVRFVRVAWQALSAEAPNLPRVDDFITYFQDTWLLGNFSAIHMECF